MKQSVTFPLKTKSENHFRRGNPQVHHAMVARERLLVRMVLDQELEVYGFSPRVGYVVTLTRYSAGTLDDDNLRGAFKATRDAVARWLGIDDGSDRIRWDYEQRPGTRGKPAVRITIDDQIDQNGPSFDVGIDTLPKLPPKPKKPKAPKPPPASWATRSFVRMPLDADPEQDREAWPIPALQNDADPPVWIHVDWNGLRYTLHRERFEHPKHGPCWLYCGGGDGWKPEERSP